DNLPFFRVYNERWVKWFLDHPRRIQNQKQHKNEWATKNRKDHRYQEIPPRPGTNVASHTALIIIDGETLGTGTGRTNKQAREAAASHAAQILIARGESIYE
ncbi:hypothetical protein FRC15_006481, partial [Serendipita sp. 397]